jgi:hypothetical protein
MSGAWGKFFVKVMRGLDDWSGIASPGAEEREFMFTDKPRIAEIFSPTERIVLYPGDCLDFLRTVPSESMQLIVTSPPYNLGKEYEKRLHLERYLHQQE